MRNVFVTLLSILVLAVAYGYSFGVPVKITQLLEGDTPAQTQAPEGAARGGPGGNGGGRGSRGATTVVQAPLEAREYIFSMRAVGSAVSLHRAEVTTTETGEVVASTLRANAMVEKGDVLLQLDDRTQRLALEIAEANRDQAQSTLTRYQGLRGNGSGVVTEVALAEAEVALRLAQANVGLAELALENRAIVAPISGRLGLSDIQIGDILSNNDLIVTIDDSTTLLATFEVPERSIGFLIEGKPVHITTPTYTGRVFEGTVTAFDSRLDSVTRSATVEAEIDNAEGLLLSGMTFAVRMSEATDPLPVVQSTAITWERAGAGIWVVDDGSTKRVPVTIRYRDGDQVWIDTDAPIGAQVVTEGASKLREGSQVAATPKPKGAGV